MSCEKHTSWLEITDAGTREIISITQGDTAELRANMVSIPDLKVRLRHRDGSVEMPADWLKGAGSFISEDQARIMSKSPDGHVHCVRVGSSWRYEENECALYNFQHLNPKAIYWLEQVTTQQIEK